MNDDYEYSDDELPPRKLGSHFSQRTKMGLGVRHIGCVRPDYPAGPCMKCKKSSLQNILGMYEYGYDSRDKSLNDYPLMRVPSQAWCLYPYAFWRGWASGRIAMAEDVKRKLNQKHEVRDE